jgi:hypothetical protein
LSHPDVACWIEKTNRYTSRANRAGCSAGPEGLAAFAHERIDHWMAATKDDDPKGYPAAAAVLRAVYDIVDAIKQWEAARGLDGATLFAEACAAFDAGRRTEVPVATNLDHDTWKAAS